MRTVRILAVLLVAAVAFGGGYVLRGRSAGGSSDSGRRILYYVDPMHPAYTSDKPGIAPDCGMRLEPVYADGGGPPAHAPQAPRKILYYRDPADHAYHADVPGLNPETGNTLEAVYEEPAAMPPGTIQITPARQQLIGVRFADVTAERGRRTVRTSGQVTHDETRVAHVHTRFDGWVERVHADFTGQVVRKGQVLLTVYSPEMLASQQELLLAARARSTMSGSSLSSAMEHSESLFSAARRRLELWQLTDAQIDRVLASGEPVRTVPVVAPAPGYVIERNVFPNQRITAETDLYTIVDLSRVWILADVFEADLGSVRIGQPVRVRLPYADSPPLTARVSYIQPQMDPTTRTMKVRLEVANPGLRLKPNMFVDVEFDFPGAERLTVPADAVIDTGTSQVVFVDRGNGLLEPRAVSTGERTDGRVAIAGGLTAQDRVVASGAFLVDSESRLRAAAAAVKPAPAPPAGAPARTSHPGGAAHAWEPSHD
jgi:RND family efflux transporter MFP subunit